MSKHRAKAVDEETYFIKTLSKSTIRISALSLETYTKLMRHIQEKNITPYVTNQRGPCLHICKTRPTPFYINQRNQKQLKQERTPCIENY
jgi:hypothetical protein